MTEDAEFLFDILKNLIDLLDTHLDEIEDAEITLARAESGEDDSVTIAYEISGVFEQFMRPYLWAAIAVLVARVLEDLLTQRCDAIARGDGMRFRPGGKGKSIPESFRRFFESRGLPFPSGRRWQDFQDMYRLRNVFAHSEGVAWERDLPKVQAEWEHLAARWPGLKLAKHDDSYLRLSEGKGPRSQNVPDANQPRFILFQLTVTADYCRAALRACREIHGIIARGRREEPGP